MEKDNQVVQRFIEQQRPRICELIDRLITEISSEERITSATYPQLVTGIQTLLKSFKEDLSPEQDNGILSEIFGEFNNII